MMKKSLISKVAFTSIVTTTLLLTGCNESSKAEVVEEKVQKPTVKKEVKVEKKEEKQNLNIYSSNDDVINEVFKDTAKVAPDGKEMILIFGTNTDPYSDKLKEDIKTSETLQKKLKDEFSSYYFKAHENLRHKQFHEGQLMDVDTKTMIAVYGIAATPTLIFTDKNGKAAIVVPGYMPAKQFEVTMNFIKDGKYKGKDRKNGEVYEALRDYYLANGIDVRKNTKDN